MNNLNLDLRSPKGRCRGNQFLLVLSASMYRIGLACEACDSVDDGIHGFISPQNGSNKTTKSANAALDTDRPINWPINNN